MALLLYVLQALRSGMERKNDKFSDLFNPEWKGKTFSELFSLDWQEKIFSV
ncbi:hypothetical protein C1645_831728 [Glomus cerebriforme]|uniref:Uncharacterized protein n=1 Tax=Glomus cerebriforme TaxID=658196 RepID=A0A397SQ89_9GLOM|nr:hypothetical protein C1645_831728 [Glomus cerebriforme]